MKLLALAVAFLVGVVVADRLDPPSSALWLFALAFLTLAALLPAVLLLLLALGALRFVLSGAPVSALIAYHGPRLLQLQGIVVADPEAAGTATRFRLAVDQSKQTEGWIDASGDVLVTLRPSTELAPLRVRHHVRYGDRLLLEGVLAAPPTFEDFDYPAYLARQGIGTVISFPETTLLNEGEGSPSTGGCTARAAASPTRWPRSSQKPRRRWARRFCWGCGTTCPRTS